MKELYSDSLEAVSSCIDELYQDEQNYKRTWANQAKRNVAFANGDQNPNVSGSPIMVNNNPINTLQGDQRTNMYQTNEIEPIIRTLVSYMTRSKPSVECKPVDDEPRAKSVAKVAERINEAKYDLDNEGQNSSDAAFWALTTGTVFGKDYWDYSRGSQIQEPVLDESGQPAIDEMTGEPKVQSKNVGNNATAILTAFTVSVDHSITDFKQQPYVGENYIMDVDWARQAFDVDKPGYTGLALSIEEDGYTSDTLGMLEDMKFAVPYVSTGGGMRTSSKGKCLIREWYIKPSADFPKGRLIIKAGNKVVYASDAETGSPYFLETEETIWHPYSMFRYEPYIGRFLGKSLVEQLIPLQMRLNEINGAILENANTMAKPNIMAAIGQLKRGVMNGKGANIYTYQHIPGAAPPFVLSGAPLPKQFFEERQILIDEMVRIAGTNFVMQGTPPTGVTAAAAIQQLLENANTQHSNTMILWERFHEERFGKKLRIIHKFNIYPDKSLNRKLAEITESCLDTQVHDFVGASDLSDGINLKVQNGSMIPKSETAKNGTYMDLAKGGFLSPRLNEPGPFGDKLRSQLHEKLGLESLESDESTELKKAKWENDRLLAGEPVEVSEYDVIAIHRPCHVGQIQDPKFLENATDEQKIALDDHIKAHDAMDMQMQQQKMNEQADMQMQAERQALEKEVTGQKVNAAMPDPSLMQGAPPIDAPMQ